MSSFKRKRADSPQPGTSTGATNGHGDGRPRSECAGDHRIYTSAAQVGKPAPAFDDVPAVVNGVFKDVSLKTYYGKYVILLFYPQDFTFVEPTEIIAFSERAAEFRDLVTEILAISVDSKYSHLAWTNVSRDKGGLGNVRIPLLSDVTHNISKDYGVFDESSGHSARALFVIDPKGIVRHAAVHDLGVGRSVDETKRVLEALQYQSEYGDVCPADWNVGKPTIMPSPDDSREYFKMHHK
ncbi:hypothetical protein RvY_14602 [Ramazzottius varieornatus]|uniref:thioredoxin-dependent peroxiredoxin n=1 Tax=Ramazzottius varieornatus TaxID=947166 RepID=A0A1D1W0B5_RAMVA|nr:hypothetical protein RvY_14602 [Ramazzottius varieornatus]